VLRKLWHTAVAGATSLAASVLWIVIVALVPAGSRPYIGSTLHNDPWEMVFGYNGLGRFGSSTADATAYNSFTPPFSGSAGIFRLFNEQVAGQIAWMIPASILAVAVLGMLRFRLSVTVFLGVWIATFLAMFSAVAGMHQFYTAALAVPMGLAVGLAFGRARSRRVPWAQMALIAIAAVTALVIGFSYGGYSIVAACVQLAFAAAAIGMIAWETRRVAMIRTWTALVATGGMLLTPAVWSAVTIANPSSTNPVAGGVADMGGFGRQASGGFGGQAPGGFGGQAGGRGGAGQVPGGQGGFGGQGQGSAAQAPNGGRFGGGVTGADSTALLAYLKANAGDAKYLVAVFGAQTAAGLIMESDGGSVLPIGGFSGNDPVPTLAEFQAMVAAGDVKYVLTSGRGGGFGGGGTGASSEIMSWVETTCTSVTDASVSGLYQCSASSASS
ncbi:MAG: 4-amino-4-deoxy-L-arabinose transferase, partial [Microbacterium sp.]|nr:4-amino-4-deoxy-L-arabinose transferase [Microbacterium sp.]